MTARVRKYVRQHHVALLALVIAMSGTAWALEANTIRSRHIVNGHVRAIDVDPDQVQLRVGEECPSGQSIRVVHVDGGVECETDDVGEVGDAGIPAGAVSFFNLAVCPSGWSELTTARGRYLVGLPSGGTPNTTVGTALSNGENRAVGQHNHTVSDPGHHHSIAYPVGLSDADYFAFDLANYLGVEYSQTSHTTTGISIGYTGSVSGTNAPYLQLLVCQKD